MVYDKKQKNFLIIEGGQVHYEAADFLKGFSIITIVLMHIVQNYLVNVPGFVYTASSLGGAGVHLFFICSGFGLYLSYLRHKQTFPEFIRRRFSKIYIPYIIVVLVSFFVPCMYEGSDRFIALLSHIFLFKMFMPAYEQSLGGQFWYISTIIQFYIVFIPLCYLRKKAGKKRIFLLICLALSALWWVFTYVAGISGIRIWASFFLQYLWEFALGMCIAEHLSSGGSIKVRRLAILIVSLVCIAVNGIMALSADALKTFNDIFSVFGFGCLVIFIYSLGIGWFNRLMLWFSKISYEWYLVHILLITVIFEIADPQTLGSSIIAGLVSLPITIAAAYFYNKAISLVSGKLKKT